MGVTEFSQTPFKGIKHLSGMLQMGAVAGAENEDVFQIFLLKESLNLHLKYVLKVNVPGRTRNTVRIHNTSANSRAVLAKVHCQIMMMMITTTSTTIIIINNAGGERESAT